MSLFPKGLRRNVSVGAMYLLVSLHLFSPNFISSQILQGRHCNTSFRGIISDDRHLGITRVMGNMNSTTLIHNLCNYDYHCCGDHLTSKLLSYTIARKSRSIFNHHEFFSLISNKTLSFVGDSLILQQFNDLDATFRSLTSMDKTRSYNGNGTHYCPTPGCKFIPPKHYSAIRWYPEYNATIQYCRDNFVDTIRLPPKDFKFCLKKALDSDYLVIGTGIWWAVKLSSSFWGTPDDRFTLAFPIMRSWLQQNSRANIILRNMSPCGIQNDLLKLKINPVCPLDMKQSDTYWVNRYNHIVRAVAEEYGDMILDVYSSTQLFIRGINDNTTIVYNDTIHFCAGGLPRIWNGVLQLILKNINKCFRHNTLSLSCRAPMPSTSVISKI
eukprot:gene2552-4985_t